ncbi:MAG TPA: SpoIIE family protein phosphatase [Leptospiraceae bacterium]|nr:SpoIIE family protein phosphatase [Leptospiraceae bacterium]
MRWFFLVAVLALCSRVSAAPIQGPWQYVWEKGNPEEIIAGRVAFETTQRPSQIPGRHGDIVWLVHSFDSSAGKTIYAANVSQLLEVYANGRLIYKFGSIDPIARSSYRGNPFHMFDLPDGFKGDVYFRVYSSGDVIGLRGILSQGDRSEHIVSLFRNDLARLLLGLCFILMALVGALLAFTDQTEAHKAFASFCFSVGVFVVTTTRIKHLMDVDALVWSYLNLASIMLMPAFFALFLRSMFSLNRLWNRITLIIPYSLFLFLAAGVLLCLAGFAQIIDFLTPFNVAALICAVSSLAFVVREAFRKSPDARVMIGGGVMMAIAATHDIALESFGFFPSTGIWLHWGMLCLILTLAFLVRKRYVEMFGRYQKVSVELELARKIQASLLPRFVPDDDKCRISVLFSPAASVGGDLYEFHHLPNHSVSFFVGDVSGHGVPAAMLSSLVKAAVSIQFTEGRLSPPIFLSSINEFLCRQLRGNFVTAFYGHIDLKAMKLAYATAGHPHAYLWNPDRTTVTRIRTRGKMLGLFADLVFEEEIVPLQPGDRILIPTDGILECENQAGRLFEEEGIERVISAHAAAPDLIVRLETALRAWTGLRPGDDQTALLVDLKHTLQE